MFPHGVIVGGRQPLLAQMLRSRLCFSRLRADVNGYVSGSEDGTVRVWEVDWEFEFPAPIERSEGVQPLLGAFLRLHVSFGPDWMSRAGAPQWSEADFDRLRAQLAGGGFGPVKDEAVRAPRGGQGGAISSVPLGALMPWERAHPDSVHEIGQQVRTGTMRPALQCRPAPDRFISDAAAVRENRANLANAEEGAQTGRGARRPWHLPGTLSRGE